MTFSTTRPPRRPYAWLSALTALFLLLFSAPAARADAVPPGCTGSGLGILLFTDALDIHIGDTLKYSVTVFNGADTGPIVCDATGIQASLTTPDGVIHPITLVRTSLSNGQADFYKDVVSYVVRAQDILPDGTVRATARDTGIIHQNDTDSQGGGNQGVNTEVSQPCIKLAVVCVPGVGENGVINFSGTVTNCGNNTLVGVTIVGFVNGAEFPVTVINTLARGQVAPFSGSFIPANPCVPTTARLTATARDEFTLLPRTVTSFADTTCAEILTPSIQVTKVCPTEPVRPGQLLTFSGTVRNTGNVTLTNIVVVNDRPAAGTPVFTVVSLAPGASADFTGSYVAPVNCTVADTLTARASSICGVAVSNTASATCPILTTPQIEVTAVCPTTPITPGGSFTYTGTVRNTGDIPLVNVVVVSDRPSANTSVFTVASLAPGASANFSRAYTVPAGACSVTTTFTATGKDQCTPNTVNNSVTTTCSVPTAPAITVTLACPTAGATAGGSITYTGVVRNSGNVTLNNVTVINNQAVPNTVLTVPTLAPGATASYTANFAAPVDACSVSSTVTVSGTDSCSGTVVNNTASATCNLVTTPRLVVTQECPAVPATPGGPLTYSGTVRNTGNITVTNVVVVNNLSGATPVFTTATLAPGEVANFSGSFVAPVNCSIASTSTATGRSICGVAVTATVSATCTIQTAPQIAVTANCPTTAVAPGASLVQTGTVRNTGNIALVNVVVVSDVPAPNTSVFTVASLAPGASANFTRAFTVPANACSVVTTFSATGRDTCTQTPVTQSVTTTCTVTTAPAITVTLLCPPTAATAGGLITYTGTVRNSGNITLNNVTVVNNQANTVLNLPTLAAGATANFTSAFTAPVDACTVTSTVTATGADSCSGTVVTKDASATCNLVTTPGIVVTQTCPVNPAIPGSPLTFSGTVRNSGNITLTNVVVLNNLKGTTPVFTTATLAPGAIAEFTGSFSAPTNCTVASTSTATGRSICGVAVTSTASATCTILTTPDILVTLACPATPPPLGGTLRYTGTVKNTGNTPLSNVSVVNNRSGTTPVFTAATLAPGATATFSGSYTIPPNCCSVSSTVTGRGTGCDGRVVTDTATSTCLVQPAPAITVTKVCPTNSMIPGQTVTFRGTINNTGNISLTDVTLVHSLSTDGLAFFGPVTLAPGETINYTGTYTIPIDFCGPDTVTVRGTACDRTITNSVTSTCPIITAPAIEVTKNCPETPPALGGTLTYTGTVRNIGNVTLINVFVTSSAPSPNTAVIGPITLAPGASADFTASFTVPNDCCEIPSTVTARGQDKCTSTTVTAKVSDVCPFLTSPAISVTRVCPAFPVGVGGLYAFTGVVSNTGDVNLTNVFVFSSQPNANTPILGPFELAPGESEDFSFSYNVAAGSDPASDTVTARGQDTCQARTVTAAANCSGPVPLFQPRITAVTTAKGMATVSWTSELGGRYILQSRDDVKDQWVSVPGNVTATEAITSKQDTMGTSPQRFYRIVVVP